jgi:hypothetical protein
MRLLTNILRAAIAAIVLPALAGANGASPDDSAQSARLRPLVGNWTCSDTGSSKPYTASVKVEGSWTVWRDTGEDVNTIYLRWSRSIHKYVVANLDGEGDVEVSTTGDTDPLNATWHVEFPAHSSGPAFTVRYARRTFSLARPYINRKGKRVVARLLCQKPG